MSEIEAMVEALESNRSWLFIPDGYSVEHLAVMIRSDLLRRDISLVPTKEIEALREIPRLARIFRSAAAEFDADPDTIVEYGAAARDLERALAALPKTKGSR
jgi:hypothetical protein